MAAAIILALASASAPMSLVGEQVKKVSSDGMAQDMFGTAVAIWGDTAVVTAPGGNAGAGVAYVFERSGASWMEVARLTAFGGLPTDSFGWFEGAAIREDTIVIGASNTDGGKGAALVFIRPAGGWADATQDATLTASDAVAGLRLGASVDIEGDTIVVGAPGLGATGALSRGAVYVFERPAGGWVDATETARLAASDADDEDFLGMRVGIEGATIVAGAHNRGNSGAGMIDGEGAAYVFVQSGDSWTDGTETALLTASDAAAYDLFGLSLDVDGTTVVVGAVNDGNAGMETGGTGSAYVFEMPEGGWLDATQNAKLIDSSATGGNQMSWSLAIDGDLIVLGAPGAMVTQAGQGVAKAYVRQQGGWSGNLAETLTIEASDGVAGQLFGGGIALSADWLVVGAFGDGPAMGLPGAVYFIARDNDGDGVANHRDHCPEDPDKLDEGLCGCGVADIDEDGDGAVDCLEIGGASAAVDADGDGVMDDLDNCPQSANPDQADADADGVGDACPASSTGACCGGGLPAALPFMVLGMRRMRLMRSAGRRGHP